MLFRTFKAATFAEVFKQVRDVLGPDAVVLHAKTSLTRTWLGLRREMSVEVTVVQQQSLELLAQWAREPKVGAPGMN